MSTRVALLFIHGIGREKPAYYHRDSILDAFRLAYSSIKQDFDGDVGVLAFPEREIRIYEVRWVSALPKKKVEKSFDIRQLHEVVWFPSLNHKYLADSRALYPPWLVWFWTIFLVPLAALLTFSYYGLSFMAKVLGRIFLYKTFARPAQVQPVDIKHSKYQDKVDDYFDQVVATIFNYVNAAGGAPAPIPAVTDSIYSRFEQTLKRAVLEDHCAEVQILAHSLGALVAYHSLTRYRDRTSKLVAFGRSSEKTSLPRLTHLLTLGSPLEKIHFFWPKLIQDSIGIAEGSPGQLAWDNFYSKGDIVSGVLLHYDHLSTVTNHPITGAGGLIAAHSRYRMHPTFLSVLGSVVAKQSTQLRKGFNPRLGRFFRAVGETLLVPLVILVLAAVGLGFMLATGWALGFALSSPLIGADWILNKVFDWNWKGIAQIIQLLQTGLAWFFSFVLVFLAIPLGRSRAKDLHKRYWQYESLPVTNEKGVIPNIPDTQRRTTTKSRFGGRNTKRRGAMTEDTDSQKSLYLTRQPYMHLFGLAFILAAIAWTGLNADGTDRVQTWFSVLILMVAFAVIAGHGVTGYWRGILIDSRYKMSLSRLQLIAWTLLILSALFAVVLTNVAVGLEAPLEVEIPSELWILLGISTASAVAAPAVLATKRGRRADMSEFTKTVNDLEERTRADINMDDMEIVVSNKSPKAARWGDLLKGDESGNAATIDVGKLQMFFFTFILLIGYGGAIAAILQSSETITALPAVQEGMNVLLGISHTGYLANKATSNSKEESPSQKIKPAIDVEENGV